MNIRKLNETLQQLLEISAETRQAVADKRKEQLKKAIDKYKKSRDLIDRHSKLDFSKPAIVSKEIDAVLFASEVIPADKMEKAEELGFIQDGFLYIPKGTELNLVKTENGKITFIIVVLNVEVTLPSSYIVRNVKSEYLSADLEIDEETKKAILDGTFEVPTGSTLAEYIVPVILEGMITQQELNDVVKNHYEMDRGQNSLFPSNWDEEQFGDFPAMLMEAICNSPDMEALGDLYNIFYKHRDFLENDECIKVMNKYAIYAFPEMSWSYTVIDYINDDRSRVVKMVDAISDVAPRLAQLIQEQLDAIPERK